MTVDRLWIEITHSSVFRCGGWAYVLSRNGVVTGAAGGERTPSAERVALTGLLDALKAAGPGVNLQIASVSPVAVGLPGRLVSADDPPATDLDLWAQMVAADRASPLRIAPAQIGPHTPSAFAIAWSELARDKAKAGGTFRAAIPKPNLAKLSL